MRIRSDIWVKALCRRAESSGAFAHIAKKGEESAGTIFVLVNNLAGVYSLYGPALTGEAARSFECFLRDAGEKECRARLSSETNFDPDLWIVEIEDRQSRSFTDSATA